MTDGGSDDRNCTGDFSAKTPHPSDLPPEVIYPDSDGKPMADNTRQFDTIVMIQGGLAAMFADRPDVFVAGDLLWYPVEGNTQIRAAPDAMVVFGRPPGYRGSYIQHREDHIAPRWRSRCFRPAIPVPKCAANGRSMNGMALRYYEYDPDRGTIKGWLRRNGLLEPVAHMEGWISP